ncbi:MAG: porin [Alcanivorax sp.]|nr:porin [Alcanivorax sp.]
MKRKLLALAVGVAIAAPVSALANAELYGRVNVSIDHFDGAEGIGDNGIYELNSNKTFFGVRGGADLTGGVRGIYQLEFGVDAASAMTDDIFFNRNTFVGLESGLGTVKAGRFDTPLRAMAFQVDQFHDQIYGDLGNLMSGEWRADRIVQYSTPQIADMITVNLATVMPEGDEINGPGTEKTKAFDVFSASVMFEFGDVYAGVGYDKNNYGSSLDNGLYLSRDGVIDTAIGANDIVRVVGGIDLDALELGVLLQEARNVDDSDLKDRSWLLSAAFNLDDAIKLKAQYGETDGRDSDIKSRQYTLGADYSLGQQTRTYVYGTRMDIDGDRNFAVVGIGAEHRF